MQRFSTLYILGFSAAVCVACSLLVSGAAVGLRDRQERNARAERQRNVLMAAGLLAPGEKADAAKIKELFTRIKPVVIELKTGQATDIDPATFDQQEATKDPDRSDKAPSNNAGITRVPQHVLVYELREADQLKAIILPIEGKGLWSTLYGFLALEADTTTIRGITFYQHGETPGLGGEVDNQRWKSLWHGRKAYDDRWEPAIEVIKGHAGSPSEAPHEVDGLSGATLTSRGVSHLVQFWLGEHGFGPYLQQLRERGVSGHG